MRAQFGNDIAFVHFKSGLVILFWLFFFVSWFWFPHLWNGALILSEKWRSSWY